MVAEAVVDVIPSELRAFRSFLRSSRSFSRIALRPPLRTSSFLVFSISLSRCRGRTGAGGILGAATPSVDCESSAEDEDAKYASSSPAAAISSGGNSEVHLGMIAFAREPDLVRIGLDDTSASPVLLLVLQKLWPGGRCWRWWCSCLGGGEECGGVIPDGWTWM